MNPAWANIAPLHGMKVFYGRITKSGSIVAGSLITVLSAIDLAAILCTGRFWFTLQYDFQLKSVDRS